MTLRRSTILLFASLFLLLHPFVSPAAAKDPVYTGTFSNVALSGFDAVAYFVRGQPVEGLGDLEYDWNGATWRFANQANLKAFKAAPQTYALQYGGVLCLGRLPGLHSVDGSRGLAHRRQQALSQLQQGRSAQLGERHPGKY
jgi:YHS domain-containing protein